MAATSTVPSPPTTVISQTAADILGLATAAGIDHDDERHVPDNNPAPVPDDKLLAALRSVVDAADASPVEQEQLFAVLTDPEVMPVWSTGAIGRLTGPAHSIRVGHNPPVFARQPPLDPDRAQAAHEHITRLRHEEVLFPNNTPWNHRIVLVRKGENTF